MCETPKCHRCKDPCHKGEERLALDGRSWHVECFTCATCGTHLDSMSLSENREENEIFCGRCYRRNFVESGYGYGLKPTLLSLDPPIRRDCYDVTPADSSVPPQPPPPPPQQPFIPVPSRLGRQYLTRKPPPRFYTNQAIVQRQVYRKCSPVTPLPPCQSSRSIHTFHPPPAPCPPNWRNSDSAHSRSRPQAPPGPPACNPASSRTAARPRSTRSNFYSNTTGREYCLRCGLEVFKGPERALGYRGVYHKSCFKCCICNASLDAKTVNEDKGKLYCRGCYTREVGPSGVGFGVGAGVLRTR